MTASGRCNSLVLVRPRSGAEESWRPAKRSHRRRLLSSRGDAGPVVLCRGRAGGATLCRGELPSPIRGRILRRAAFADVHEMRQPSRELGFLVVCVESRQAYQAAQVACDPQDRSQRRVAPQVQNIAPVAATAGQTLCAQIRGLAVVFGVAIHEEDRRHPPGLEDDATTTRAFASSSAIACAADAVLLSTPVVQAVATMSC